MTLRDYLKIVLELAEQNMIDEREISDDDDEMQANVAMAVMALAVVHKLRDAIPPCSADEFIDE